jgi:hypothetical protein
MVSQRCHKGVTKLSQSCHKVGESDGDGVTTIHTPSLRDLCFSTSSRAITCVCMCVCVCVCVCVCLYRVGTLYALLRTISALTVRKGACSGQGAYGVTMALQWCYNGVIMTLQ